MPNCAAGNSACNSRRSSRGSCCSGNYIMMTAGGGHGGGGPSSNASRRSSGGALSASSRRDSSYFVNNPYGGEQTSPAVSESAVTTHPLASYRADVPSPTAFGAASTPPGATSSNAPANILQSIGSGVVGAAAQSFSTFTPPRYRKTFLGGASGRGPFHHPHSPL